jgi:hypothetical protein
MDDIDRAHREPSARIVRRPDGAFVRLELNGEEFLPWLSGDDPIAFRIQDNGFTGLLTLTMFVSDFATVLEVE